MTLYAGDKMILTATFTNPADDTPLNPGAVNLRIREPGGGTIVERTFGGGGSPAIENPSTGVFTYEIDTTGKPGNWQYLWYSTGEGQAAEQTEFYVLRVIAAA